MATRILLYYNVEFSVGEQKPNKEDDVMLVQYFLTKLMKDWQGRGVIRDRRGAASKRAQNLQPLSVDGKADDNLYDWIYNFQSLWAKERGFLVATDGIVDPVPGPKTGAAFRRYTLGVMNLTFEAEYMDLYNRLHLDSSVPSRLREYLRQNYK